MFAPQDFCNIIVITRKRVMKHIDKRISNVNELMQQNVAKPLS